MKINFKNLHIENFMSIGEVTIDLSDRGFTLIEGVNNNLSDNAKSNGSGKSSLFEALVWALTGNTMRGNKDIVNCNGTDGALVTLTFSLDTSEFKILRTKEHSKYKTNLFIEIDGVDKSGKGIRDTEKLLSEYLPDLTSMLIGSVIVLGQGLPQKFTSNSPSGRKETLEKLFKSDYMIQDLKDRVAKRKLELDTELRRTQDEKLVNTTKINTLKETIAADNAKYLQLKEMSNSSVTAEDLNKEIIRLEKDESSVSKSLEEELHTQQDIKDKIAICKIQQAEADSNIDEKYKPLLEDIQSSINSSSVALQIAKQELISVTNMRDICPTCGQRIPNVNKPDIAPYKVKVEEAENALSSFNAQLSSVKEEISHTKRSMTQDIALKHTGYEQNLMKSSHVVKELQLKIRDIKEVLSRKYKLYTQLVSEEESRKTNIDNLISSIETNKKLVDDIIAQNITLEKEEKSLLDRVAIQNKFSTALTRDFRGCLLEEIIQYINQTVKRYSRIVFETDLIDFVLEGNNLIIRYNNKEYESLSGGERQKVDLIIQFAIRDMLSSHTSFSSNIIVLDEIFDALDSCGCENIITLITTMLYDVSSIFIITHRPDLELPVDSLIKVIKNTEGISYIEQS